MPKEKPSYKIVVELVIKAWPVIAFFCAMVGFYFMTKSTMQQHSKDIQNLQDGRGKIHERITAVAERVARLEGRNG